MFSTRFVRIFAAFVSVALSVLCSLQWLPSNLTGQRSDTQQESEEETKLPILPVDKLPPTKLHTDIPNGLAFLPPVPDGNPLTEDKAALGRKLFFIDYKWFLQIGMTDRGPSGAVPLFFFFLPVVSSYS